MSRGSDYVGKGLGPSESIKNVNKILFF